MLFRSEFRDGVRRGSITLTFRRWATPRVKVGGHYRLSPSGVLEVQAIEPLRVADITQAEARLAGFSDLASLLNELARPTRRPLGAAAKVFRIAFRYLELADERTQRAHDTDLSDQEVDRLSATLSWMDVASKDGPWTRQTLSLIEARPRVAASHLAKGSGRETPAFKLNVRKLKNLGLTLSFEVGYEISPRGRVFLERSRT